GGVNAASGNYYARLGIDPNPDSCVFGGGIAPIYYGPYTKWGGWLSLLLIRRRARTEDRRNGEASIAGDQLQATGQPQLHRPRPDYRLGAARPKQQRGQSDRRGEGPWHPGQDHLHAD